MALLEAKEVSKNFGLSALRKVSFSFDVGILIIGPNGAGKTTLFNATTEVYRPNRGMICSQGKDITGKMPGYVIENGHLILSGDSEELLTNPQIKEAYLGLR